MSERLSLQSPSARIVLGVVGVCVVLYGAHDMLTRLPQVALDPAALFAGATPPSGRYATAPTATTTELSAPSLTPARLTIPSIGVDATVEQVGNNASGAMATPKNFMDVAWYALGAKPGEAGNAVFAGHINNALTKAGVFLHLDKVSVNDKIFVEDASGHRLTYVVRDVKNYDDQSAPVTDIFSHTTASGVVLITCAGDWDAKAHSFDKRLVVYASLIAG